MPCTTGAVRGARQKLDHALWAADEKACWTCKPMHLQYKDVVNCDTDLSNFRSRKRTAGPRAGGRWAAA